MEDAPAEDVTMEEEGVQAMSGDDDSGGEEDIDSDTDNLAMHREQQPDDFPEDPNEDADKTESDEDSGGGEPEPERLEDLLELFNDSGEDESDDSGAEKGESGVKQILDPRTKVHRGGPHAVAKCCDPNCKNKDTSNELRVCVKGWRSNTYTSFFHVKCVGNIFDIDWHKEQYKNYGTKKCGWGYHDPHSATRRME